VHAEAFVAGVVVEKDHAAGFRIGRPGTGEEGTGFGFLAEEKLGEEAVCAFARVFSLGSMMVNFPGCRANLVPPITPAMSTLDAFMRKNCPPPK